MVMILKDKAAMSRNCIKFVVRKQSSEDTSRCAACAMELIIRICHVVAVERSAQATLVKLAVVRHEWQPFYMLHYLGPYFRKMVCHISILTGQSVDSHISRAVIIRSRSHQAVISVGDDSIPYYHNSHTAYGA